MEAEPADVAAAADVAAPADVAPSDVEDEQVEEEVDELEVSTLVKYAHNVSTPSKLSSRLLCLSPLLASISFFHFTKYL